MKPKSFHDMFVKARKRLGYHIEMLFLCDNDPKREDEARKNLEKFIEKNYIKRK